jgi:hypothetical protein
MFWLCINTLVGVIFGLSLRLFYYEVVRAPVGYQDDETEDD